MTAFKRGVGGVRHTLREQNKSMGSICDGRLRPWSWLLKVCGLWWWSWSEQAWGCTLWSSCLVRLVIRLPYLMLNLDRQACQAGTAQADDVRGSTKIIHCKTKKTDDTQQEQQAKSTESTIQLAGPRLPASLKWNRHHWRAVTLDHETGKSWKRFSSSNKMESLMAPYLPKGGQGNTGMEKGESLRCNHNKKLPTSPFFLWGVKDEPGSLQQQLKWLQSLPIQEIKVTPAETLGKAVTSNHYKIKLPLQSLTSFYISLKLGGYS